MAPKATKKRLHDTPAGERRIGVVLEHLDGKISLVAEQYGFNDHAFRRFNERLKDALDPNGILSPGKQGIWPKEMRGGR